MLSREMETQKNFQRQLEDKAKKMYVQYARFSVELQQVVE